MKRNVVMWSFVVIGVWLIAYLYGVHRLEVIKASPQRFVYQAYFGPPNSVIFISNLRYKEDYLEYYREIAKGKNPSFNFPLKTLPTNDPVYVIDYSSDSTLVKFVSFYDRGKYFGGSFTQGWVFRESIHTDPPPERSK